MHRSFSTSLCLLLLLTGCLQTQVTLDYQPRPASQRSSSVQCRVNSVADLRGTHPQSLGRVPESHYGLRNDLSLSTPADEAVKSAFLHGLASRSMLNERGGAKVCLSVELDEFYCELVTKPYASCKLRVTARSSSGQLLYHGAYAASRADPGHERGYRDPTLDLKELASRSLQDAVDKALDDPRLHSGS